MEVVEIFTKMHWFPALLLIVGIVMIIIELFVSGFGFFGITGIISLVAGVVVRICFGLNISQSLTLVLIVIGFLIVVFMIMVCDAQYGFLSKTALFEKGTTLSKDYNEADMELKKLVGRVGRTISKLDLGGKVKIKRNIYDVVSVSGYIEPNKSVKVVEIKDNTIMVKRWFK